LRRISLVFACSADYALCLGDLVLVFPRRTLLAPAGGHAKLARVTLNAVAGGILADLVVVLAPCAIIARRLARLILVLVGIATLAVYLSGIGWQVPVLAGSTCAAIACSHTKA
tara:strand:+ start:260 stop:598 length:339 start_codon:yes stop_codon:yes gene_type:complete